MSDPVSGEANNAPSTPKKIAICVVAYNAVNTLRRVLDRIPDSVWEKTEEVYVFDDSSQDDTYLVGLGYKVARPGVKLSIFRNDKNLGYGGNQIRGYQYAIDKGYDIVALLHGDGQYAPETLPELLAPLERGEADAVFGSRLLVPGRARAGGMPLYKYIGNKILSGFENAALGMNLSEFHSGYRLYSVQALRKIPFHRNTHDFHFDTQIIIQMHAAGMRIVEVPIPTYYGDEICYVNGMKYAKDVVRSVLQFRMHEFGLASRPEYDVEPTYPMKRSPLSSHAQLLQLVGPPRQEVLDIGCGTGELGSALRQRGHYVVGVDERAPQHALDEFIRADLRHLPFIERDRLFDVVLLADVLEHMEDPSKLLEYARDHLRTEGRLLLSLPNVVHWTVRAQLAAGRFDYTNRGILDRGHLRFFTRRSAERLFEQAGLVVTERRTTPIPWENVLPQIGTASPSAVEQADYTLTRLSPDLFAYQHLFELRRARVVEEDGIPPP
jgi:glycosyltransferase involved in cell wall biosynthesis